MATTMATDKQKLYVGDLFKYKSNITKQKLESQMSSYFIFSKFKPYLEGYFKDNNYITRDDFKKALYAFRNGQTSQDTQNLVTALHDAQILTDVGRNNFGPRAQKQPSPPKQPTVPPAEAVSAEQTAPPAEAVSVEEFKRRAIPLVMQLNKMVLSTGENVEEASTLATSYATASRENNVEHMSLILQRFLQLKGLTIPDWLLEKEQEGVEETKDEGQSQGQSSARSSGLSGSTVMPRNPLSQDVPSEQTSSTSMTPSNAAIAAMEEEAKRQQEEMGQQEQQRGRSEQPTSTRKKRSRTAPQKGMSVAQDNQPSVVVSMNNNPGGAAQDAVNEIQQSLPPPANQGGNAGESGQVDEDGGGGGGVGEGPPPQQGEEGDDEQDAQITSQSTRQSELSSAELVSLQYKANLTEVLDNQFMRLAKDSDRGNLGAGTTAEMQSADLWGNLITQSRPDKIAIPERPISTQPGSTAMSDADSSASTEDVYSFLPFAKLGGSIVWIPRHVQAARFFFTSDDYTELVSHVRDGNPLTLDSTGDVDPVMMRSSITNTHSTLMVFCQLSSKLPASANTEQLYAEWLEMKQIGKAVARYQQITGGMYENTDLTMKGGIRAAVASSLKPFIQAWNQLHPNDTIATDEQGGRPASRPLFSAKRKAEAGVVMPEEYNPQFSYAPLDLKRVKFSIPNI